MHKLHLGRGEWEEALSHEIDAGALVKTSRTSEKGHIIKNTPFFKDLCVKAEDIKEKSSLNFVLLIPQTILSKHIPVMPDRWQTAIAVVPGEDTWLKALLFISLILPKTFKNNFPCYSYLTFLYTSPIAHTCKRQLLANGQRGSCIATHLGNTVIRKYKYCLKI